jgi:hypothetical protein
MQVANCSKNFERLHSLGWYPPGDQWEYDSATDLTVFKSYNWGVDEDRLCRHVNETQSICSFLKEKLVLSDWIYQKDNTFILSIPNIIDHPELSSPYLIELILYIYKLKFGKIAPCSKDCLCNLTSKMYICFV